MPVKPGVTGDVVAEAFSGSCVCGTISYRAEALRPLWYCHCRQCRNMTGHFMAAAQVDIQQIEIDGEPKWYYVSAKSRYGFCPNCGAQLFWRNDDNAYLSVTGGSLDDSGKLVARGHIFTGEKGRYYDLPSEQLQFERHCDSGEL